MGRSISGQMIPIDGDLRCYLQIAKTILTRRFDYAIAMDNYGNSNNQYSTLVHELFRLN